MNATVEIVFITQLHIFKNTQTNAINSSLEILVMDAPSSSAFDIASIANLHIDITMAHDTECNLRSKQQRRRKPYRPIERADGVIIEHPRYTLHPTSPSALPAVLQHLQPRSTKPVFEKHLFTLPPHGQNIWSKHQQSQHNRQSKRVHPAIERALQHQSKCQSPPSNTRNRASNDCDEDSMDQTESNRTHVPGIVLDSHDIRCIGTFASDLNDERYNGTDSLSLQGRSGYNDTHSPGTMEYKAAWLFDSDSSLEPDIRKGYSIQRLMEESGPWSTTQLRLG